MEEVRSNKVYQAELNRTARTEAKAAASRRKGRASIGLTSELMTQYVCAENTVGECIRSALNAWSFRYAKGKQGKIMRTCNLCHKEEEACLTAIHVCSRDAPIIEHPPVVCTKIGGQQCGLCFQGPSTSHACQSRLFKRCMVDAHGHPDLNPELVLKEQASSQAAVSKLLDQPLKLYDRSFFMSLKSDGYIGAANVVQAPSGSQGRTRLTMTNMFVGDAGDMGRGLYALSKHDSCSPLSLIYGGSIQPTTNSTSEPGLSRFDREIVLRDGSTCVVNVEPLDTKCVAYLINHAHHKPNMESVDGPCGVTLVTVRTVIPGEQFLYNYLAVCDDLGEEMMCKCERCSAAMTPEGRDRYMVVWKGRRFPC